MSRRNQLSYTFPSCYIFHLDKLTHEGGSLIEHVTFFVRTNLIEEYNTLI
jgi:hypothetical protein